MMFSHFSIRNKRLLITMLSKQKKAVHVAKIGRSKKKMDISNMKESLGDLGLEVKDGDDVSKSLIELMITFFLIKLLHLKLLCRCYSTTIFYSNMYVLPGKFSKLISRILVKC